MHCAESTLKWKYWALTRIYTTEFSLLGFSPPPVTTPALSGSYATGAMMCVTSTMCNYIYILIYSVFGLRVQQQRAEDKTPLILDWRDLEVEVEIWTLIALWWPLRVTTGGSTALLFDSDGCSSPMFPVEGRNSTQIEGQQHETQKQVSWFLSSLHHHHHHHHGCNRRLITEQNIYMHFINWSALTFFFPVSFIIFF